MKKLFALCALIFAIGMIVNFSPGDPSPQPDTEQVSTYDQSDWSIADVTLDASPAYLVQASHPDSVAADLPEADDVASNAGFTNYLTTKPNHADSRIDKRIDPGRCSVI